MTNKNFGKIIAIATSVCVILLCIAFIFCTAHLYFTGGAQPYSSERVGDYLGYLLVPSIITVMLVIVGIVYNVKAGETVEENSKRTNRELLESFKSRYVFESFGTKAKAEARAIEKKRNVIGMITCQLTSFCLVLIVDYMIFLAIAVAVHIPRIYYEESLAEKELSLLKQSIKEEGKPTLASAPKENKKFVISIRYAILGIAAILVVLGIFNEGVSDVLQKAVKICTECIGLG